MPKLSKEEIIKLYKKPNSMTPMEIWKQGDYFTSITTIRKYIKEAIELGQITAEDEEIFRQRKIVEIEQKENRKALLKDLILQELKTRNLSRAEMAKTIEEKQV